MSSADRAFRKAAKPWRSGIAARPAVRFSAAACVLGTVAVVLAVSLFAQGADASHLRRLASRVARHDAYVRLAEAAAAAPSSGQATQSPAPLVPAASIIQSSAPAGALPPSAIDIERARKGKPAPPEPPPAAANSAQPAPPSLASSAGSAPPAPAAATATSVQQAPPTLPPVAAAAVPAPAIVSPAVVAPPPSQPPNPAPIPVQAENPPGPPAAVGSVAATAPTDSDSTSLDAEPAPTGANIQTFEGTNEFVNPRRKRAAAAVSGGDTTLDFSNADVKEVVRSVLGDILHVPYTIDPQVSGRVTLNTSSPITQDDVLPALEAALVMAGVAMTENDGIYNVVPIASAQHSTPQIFYNADGARSSGYGVEIFPLKYVSAEEMQQLLEPLTPQGSIVRIDAGRNLMFLVGTEPERARLRETISLFDVDYLKSMSFALVQPEHVDVTTLAGELDKIFEGTGSSIAGLVRLIPIARINSLLVVTSRSAYLTEVTRWVKRLDVVPVGPGRRLYYYRLQNVRAQDVAQTISELFGGGSHGETFALGHGEANSGAPAPMPAGQPAGAGTGGAPLAASLGGAMRAGPDRGDDSGPQIVTDAANNALIIRADPADYASIEKVVQQMDVAPDQVLIEATIAEVTLNDQLKLGVEWAFQTKDQNYTLSSNGAVLPSFPGFAFTYSVPNVKATLSALGTLTNVAILSSPKLLTLDNKPAHLEVGQQVPIVTQTATSVNAADAPLVSTVQMLDTGVILSVTPRIGKSGMVFLDVSQEVSDVIPTTTSGIDSPTVEQRKVESTVGVKDGQTIVLGGIISQEKDRGSSGIPFLKDIPVLGVLAGTHSAGNSKTELLVFLTPRVVRDTSGAAAITDDLIAGLDDVKRALDDFKAPEGHAHH